MNAFLAERAQTPAPSRQSPRVTANTSSTRTSASTAELVKTAAPSARFPKRKRTRQTKLSLTRVRRNERSGNAPFRSERRRSAPASAPPRAFAVPAPASASGTPWLPSLIRADKTSQTVDIFSAAQYNLNAPTGRVPLAQLDRASGYGPEGRGFESLMVRQLKRSARPVVLIKEA